MDFNNLEKLNDLASKKKELEEMYIYMNGEFDLVITLEAYYCPLKKVEKEFIEASVKKAFRESVAAQLNKVNDKINKIL